MFKSIQDIKYLGYDKETELYSYLFKIEDEDFEEEITGALGDRAAHTRDIVGVRAVIKTYSKRNLNVSKNLLLLFMFYEKEYGKKYYSIEKQIENCMKYQPLFQKYKEEVEKYLTLV
jgi:hypothetical protein